MPYSTSGGVDPDSSLISAQVSHFPTTGAAADTSSQLLRNKDSRHRSVLVPMPRTPGTLNFSTRKK